MLYIELWVSTASRLYLSREHDVGIMSRVQIEWTPNMRGVTLMLLTEPVELHRVWWWVGGKAFVAYDKPTKQSDKVKFSLRWLLHYVVHTRRKAFLNFDFSFVCSDPHHSNPLLRTTWSGPDFLHVPKPTMSKARTQWSSDNADLLWPSTPHLSSGQGVGSLFYHASLMQSDGSRSGQGWCRLSPKTNEALKAGGRRRT